MKLGLALVLVLAGCAAGPDSGDPDWDSVVGLGQPTDGDAGSLPDASPLFPGEQPEAPGQEGAGFGEQLPVAQPATESSATTVTTGATATDGLASPAMTQAEDSSGQTSPNGGMAPLGDAGPAAGELDVGDLDVGEQLDAAISEEGAAAGIEPEMALDAGAILDPSSAQPDPAAPACVPLFCRNPCVLARRCCTPAGECGCQRSLFAACIAAVP